MRRAAGRSTVTSLLGPAGPLHGNALVHLTDKAYFVVGRVEGLREEPAAWVAVVREGTILYELGGVTEEQAKICFARLAHKMPVKVRFVRRRPA